MPDQSNNIMPGQKAKPSKEDQALVDMFLINGMEMIYDDKTTKAMLARISTNEDPTKAIAEFLVDVIMRIIKSAKGAGKDIQQEFILTCANFLLAEIFKVLEAAGMEPLTEEQAVGVWQTATSIYLDKAVKSGMITEQELTVLSEQAKQTEAGQKIMKAEGQGQGQAQGQAQAQAQPVAAPMQSAPAQPTQPAPMAAPQRRI